MVSSCPNCQGKAASGTKIVRDGFYYRTDDSRWIQRYWCSGCKKGFSDATGKRWFRAKKRRFHEALRKDFASLGGVRPIARDLSLNRKTVARKLVILGEEAEERFRAANLRHEKTRVVEFDDMETFEHTRCKPLSITLAVQRRTERILGFEVSSMAAKGKLVERARKYGPREDTREEGRNRLFLSLKDLVHEEAQIRSDSHPAYPRVVKAHFPQAHHVTFLSRRGSNTGGGELKEGVFDPLFALNNTCACLRMRVTRLLRKTWYTTKRPDRLRSHLYIYAEAHNRMKEAQAQAKARA
jgi:transposase-like protein